jgi:quercetin dioxygenase-like cupin family protein
MASTVKVTRWSQNWLPTEAELRQKMLAHGLQPYGWSNAAGDTYPPHSHPYHKVIFVVEGSITFGLPEEGTAVVLTAGDRLDLPAGMLHDAQVGRQGVACLEAHQRGDLT